MKDLLMSAKAFIYVLVSIIVIWSFESVNINAIFRKNKVWQARIFYFLLALSMIYLVTNFIYDLYLSFKFI